MSTFMKTQNMYTSGKTTNFEMEEFDLHAVPDSKQMKVNDQLLHQFEQGLLNQHKSVKAGGSAVVAGGGTIVDNDGRTN